MAGKLTASIGFGASGSLWVALFGALLLTGCAAPGDPGWQHPASLVNTWVYQCEPEYRFVAREERALMWLFLPRHTLTLKPDFEGADSYSAEGYRLVQDGEMATLRLAENDYRCRNDRRAAIWEASKLNGYDYRATGNEPGWYLEIGQGMRSHLVSQSGQSRLDFRLPAPWVDEAARLTVYRVPEMGLEIRIEGQFCQDTMSGEAFSSTVSIVWQGQILNGCGRALH